MRTSFSSTTSRSSSPWPTPAPTPTAPSSSSPPSSPPGSMASTLFSVRDDLPCLPSLLLPLSAADRHCCARTGAGWILRSNRSHRLPRAHLAPIPILPFSPHSHLTLTDPPGEVVSGQEVMKAVEALGSDSGKPTKTVTIVQSGIIE
jgi:hypothetical protein